MTTRACLPFVMAWLTVSVVLLPVKASATEFIVYVPLSRTAKVTSPVEHAASQVLPPPSAQVPAEAMAQWQSYCKTWRDHHADPANETIRRKLGISDELVSIRSSSGRATAAAMRLPISDMLRFESEHFVLLSDVPEGRAVAILQDLERFYIVWTQLCFPLWKDRITWDHAAKPNASRPRVKHRIVLFAARGRYADVLRDVGPGVEQSTGFYSDLKRITFLREDADDRATRYHEVTHQLMSEATPAKSRLRPGERSDFWLIEGIACYFESTRIHSTHATVGGWHSPRLQYARHRVLGLSDRLPLAALRPEGRLQVQQREDLSRWYLFSAAYTHQAIDADHGQGLVNVLQSLASLYQMSSAELERSDAPEFDRIELEDYLRLSDENITSAPPDSLTVVCLNRTNVTAAGLAKLPPQSTLTWFDGGFLAINDDDLTRLIPKPAQLETLGMEATQISDQLADWLSQTALRELDLSHCQIGDALVQAISPASPIETLWLTGSRVSDASVEHLIKLQTLQRLDVQRTGISDAGLARLQAALPQLELNPLDVTP